MKTLSETWFAEGFIDFELKKYTLLAYLQQVSKFFGENKLYPQLADLIFHYNNLVAFRENKKYLQEQFPKKLSGVQIENLQVLYEQLIEDTDLMAELEEIIHYAAGAMKTTISNGAEIYEFVETKLNIAPVGLVPLDVQEGYFLLSPTQGKTTWVYHYRLSFFDTHDARYRSIKTVYVDCVQRSLGNTFESMKYTLLKTNAALPNPAVYSIEANLAYPVQETLLPIAKRSLVKYITTAA